LVFTTPKQFVEQPAVDGATLAIVAGRRYSDTRDRLPRGLRGNPAGKAGAPRRPGVYGDLTAV
jgi:hypothetical protein